jgi:hypothetical protein
MMGQDRLTTKPPRALRSRTRQRGAKANARQRFLFATLRKASSIRDCQPGPLALK